MTGARMNPKMYRNGSIDWRTRGSTAAQIWIQAHPSACSSSKGGRLPESPIRAAQRDEIRPCCENSCKCNGCVVPEATGISQPP